MNQNNSKDSGSFATGFMLGIAAGALGYFAFGTKKGAGVRKHLQEEWQSARKHLAENVDPDHQIVETAQSVFGQLKQTLEKSFSSFDGLAMDAVESDKKSAAKKKRTRASRFKGV